MKAIEIILGILLVIVAFGGLFYWISSYMSNSTDKVSEKSDNFLNVKIASGKLEYFMKRAVDSAGDSYYQGSIVKLKLPVSFNSYDVTKNLNVTFLANTGSAKEVVEITFNSTGVDGNKISSKSKSLTGDETGLTLQLNTTNAGYDYYDIIAVDYDGTSFDVE